MSEPRRTPGRFVWLLPLGVFVLVLSLDALGEPAAAEASFQKMISQ